MMKRFVSSMLLCLMLSVLSACGETSSASSTPRPTVTQSTESTPTAQAVHFPPTTVADLHGLAAKGNASAIHEFHSESVGLASCPQPKRSVVVDQQLTGQQLAEDLLAYFYAQQLDNSCGSLVLAYHDQSEGGNVYTAGRIGLDVTNSKHQLTLDVGDVTSGHQYIVTY